MPKLTWTGKDKVINHHHEVPFRILDKSYNFTASDENSHDNRIIHGDNLEALKSLLPEFEGKIKCIYIDPPYNTGNEGWIYNDNVNDEKIKRWLGNVVGKEGEDLSRHDKWLCMMYPRLKLLHKLLANDGVIFISIDDNEQANLKLIMDEIFGIGNFVATLTWQKRVSPANDAKYFSSDHEYLLLYCKNKNSLNINRLPRTKSQEANYKNPDNDLRGVWNSVTYTCNKTADERPNLYYALQNPNTGEMVFPKRTAVWKYDEKRHLENVKSNLLFWGNDGKSKMPRLKRFLSEVGDVVPRSILFYEDYGHTQEARTEILSIFADSEFNTPKPSRLIERILQIATDKNSIILDSFAGSGTTAHAVLKLNAEDGGNRKFILIETMDYAEDITAERVRRVMNGYGEGAKAVSGLGGAFDFYEIGDVIFDESGNLNEEIGTEEIRKYVAFTENIALVNQTEDSPYLLGKVDETAYFFIYEKDKITALNLDFLATLDFKPQALVVYADNCLLSKELMQKYNIIFKKIPRDITRF